MLAHLGASKTLSYLHDNVWWKDIVSDVKAYCNTCITCRKSKPSNQKPYGLLNPLLIPSEGGSLIRNHQCNLFPMLMLGENNLWKA